MSRYLLDTHVWLWMQTDPERLRPDALELIEDVANELLLSAASAWEIALKYRLGKLPLPEPPETYVPERMRRSGTTPLAVQHAHALAVAALPDHHNDPFDRLLVAQSQLLDAPIITRDNLITTYDVTTITA